MALLPSVKTKISTEATQYRGIVSEFLAQTFGRSINWLIDRVDAIVAKLSGAQVSHVIPVAITRPQTDTVPAGYKFTGMKFSTVNGSSVYIPVIVQGPVTLSLDQGQGFQDLALTGVSVKNADLSPSA